MERRKQRMLKEVKCLACGHILFRIGPLDERGEFWGIFEDDCRQHEKIRKTQGDRQWYECPGCQKKNWIAGICEPGKGRKTWISHVTQ